jgi:hypothetical protein
MSITNQRNEYLANIQARASAMNTPASQGYKEQEYWCRNNNCGRRIVSIGVPLGWYIVKKSDGSERPLRTVAMACSLECHAQDIVRELANRVRSIF